MHVIMQIDSYTCTIQQVSQYTHQNCVVIYIYKQAYQRYLPSGNLT